MKIQVRIYYDKVKVSRVSEGDYSISLYHVPTDHKSKIVHTGFVLDGLTLNNLAIEKSLVKIMEVSCGSCKIRNEPNCVFVSKII